MSAERGLMLLFTVLIVLLCAPTPADLVVGDFPNLFPLGKGPQKRISERPQIEMYKAAVDINVGVPSAEGDKPLDVNIKATFLMRNREAEETTLPVSYLYPLLPESGKMEGFAVVSNKERKKVELDQKAAPQYFWMETFKPREERLIQVEYVLRVPRQSQQELEKRRGVEGIFELISPKTDYFIFEYSLTSGATWEGPITKETVRLHFSDTWTPQTVLCNQAGRLKQENPSLWVYELKDEKPAQDLHFALPAGPATSPDTSAAEHASPESPGAPAITE